MTSDGSVTDAEVAWAASYNAQDRLASSTADLERLLAPARQEYRTSGRVPSWCGVDLLRGWAFLLQRMDHFAGDGALGTEWRAALEALRRHPSATDVDRPPGEPAHSHAMAESGHEHDRVLGVDACRAGWVGVVLDRGNPAVLIASDIEDLVVEADRGGEVAVVGVDIPIGLPDRGRREADALARKRVGRRSSSVFTTPVREALLAVTHAEAVTVNRARTGAGISIQAYGLRTKVLEVDRWVRRTARRVIEVHPEVSFAEMNGGGLAHSKTTPEGERERLDLLRAHGIVIDAPLKRRGAGADDVLDAAAAAWTARRHASGHGHSLPDPPQVFSDRWPAAIWV